MISRIHASESANRLPHFPAGAPTRPVSTKQLTGHLKALLQRLAALLDERPQPAGRHTQLNVLVDLMRAQAPPLAAQLLRDGAGFDQIAQIGAELRCAADEIMAARDAAEAQALIELSIMLNRAIDAVLLAVGSIYHEAALGECEKRALRDPITALYNHGYFIGELHRGIKRSLRQGWPLTLLMLDLDHLKSINDRHGHQTGNRVLQQLALVMRQVARQSDVLCRYAGDEFAIIMPDTGKEQALVAAERLRAAFAVPLQPAGRGGITLVPTISLGVASYPGDAESLEQLVMRADAALYRAKTQGRNRVAE